MDGLSRSRLMIQNKVKRKTLRETDQYRARIEEMKGILFIHIDLKGKPTKSLMKHLKIEWEIYKKKVKAAGYKHIHSYSATPSFYKFFPGYVDLGPMEWEGNEYRVLQWELN